MLEESGDIDYQVRLFKSDLMENQVDKEKENLMKDHQAQLRAYKDELTKK